MRKRIKIVFISHDAELTGAPRELLLLVKYIDKNRFESFVILGKDGPLRKQFAEHAICFVDPLYGDGIKYVRELSQISRRLRLLKDIGPNVLYCNTIMTSKWLLYARIVGVPALMHVHELSAAFNSLSICDRLLLARCASQFIAAANIVKQYLMRNLDITADAIQVFHESIEIPSDQFKGSGFKKQLFGSDTQIVIGTVGRITHVKGSDLFLKLAEQLKRSVSPAVRLKFLIVGTTGDEAFFASFKNDIAQRGLQDDVILVENAADVSIYYSVMDIYVSTAREDPFPLVILEAMASRLPIVAFAVGGIPEAIGAGCGILIDGVSVESMKDAILQLIDAPESRVKLGAAARKRVEAEFDIVRSIGKVERIIDEMAG